MGGRWRRTVGALACLLGLTIHGAAWAGVDAGAAALQSGDYTKALRELSSAARQGDPQAQYLYATMLKDGLGTGTPDAIAAVAWYRRAADSGLADAQLNLGFMLFHGVGVDRDREAGLYWYERAAQSGLAVAQYNAGKVYWDGDGVRRDPLKARGWFEAASRQNMPEAQFALGVSLLEPPNADIQAAFTWFLKAAHNGEVLAYGKVAGLYVLGEGVDKDRVAGLGWAIRGADAGDPMAMQLRTKLQNDLTPEQVAAAQAWADAEAAKRGR